MSKSVKVGTVIVLGLAISWLLVRPGSSMVAGLFSNQPPLSQDQFDQLLQASPPLDATTLLGKPGLYYLNATNLVGTLSTDRYSAYEDLVDEGKIPDGSKLITDQDNSQDNVILNQVKDLQALNSSTISLTIVNGTLSAAVIQSGIKTSLLTNDADFVTNLLSFTTDNLAQGLTNQYTQWQTILGGISYNQGVTLTSTLTLSQMTTNGGLIYTTATGQLDQLAAGTAGQCLKSTAGVPTWGACAASNAITGLGVNNYLARFNGTDDLVSSLIYDDGTNVGIGTGSPGAKLDINGTLLNNAGATFASGLYDSSAPTLRVGDAGYGLSSFGGIMNLFGASSGFQFKLSNGTNLVRIDGSGNVGLGTTGPLNKLDVAGAVAIGSYAGVNTAPTNGLIVSGNVGIGTATPGTDKLYVRGDNGSRSVNIERYSSVNLSGVSDIALAVGYFDSSTGTTTTTSRNGIASYYQKSGSGTYTSWGGTNIAANTNLSNGDAGTMSNFASRIDMNGSTALTIRDFYADSQYGTSGSAIYRMGLQVADFNKSGSQALSNQYGVHIADLSSGDYNFGIHSSISAGANKYNLYIPGTAINYLNGNVGIGTTNPGSYRLSVTGDTYLSSNLTVNAAAAQSGVIRLENGAQINYRNQLNNGDIEGLKLNNGEFFIGGAAIKGTTPGGTTTMYVVGNNGNVGIGTATPTAAKLDIVSSGTTTHGTSIVANALTTGRGLNISSTSAALTTGGLLGLSWIPSSATNMTGDLFSLNVGPNGTVGNLLNLMNDGLSVFAVSQTQITANVPVAFMAAGDMSVAYDLSFTNNTNANIKSSGPLRLQAGEVFNSSDLTLGTYNNGVIMFDSTVISTANSTKLGLGGVYAPTARLALAAGTTAADGIAFGTDTNLYRSAADTLRTDDLFITGNALAWVGIAAPGLSASGQAKAYFDSTSNTLKLSENAGAYADIQTSGRAQTQPFTSTSSDLTLAATHGVVQVDATAALRTITLPAVSGTSGRSYTIIKSAGANNVVVDGDNAETISGAADYTLTTQYQSVTIVSNGSQWIITATAP